MPLYQATIFPENPAAPLATFLFVAGSDREAAARMPRIDPGAAVEIWQDDRLAVIIRDGATTVAEADLADLVRGKLK